MLEIAGIAAPGDDWQGRPVESITGQSFAGMLTGDAATSDERAIGIELLGKRALRSGDWKLLHMPKPYGSGEWQLFNIADDVGESTDLAEKHPEVRKRLEESWQEYERENGVIIPDWVSGY